MILAYMKDTLIRTAILLHQLALFILQEALNLRLALFSLMVTTSSPQPRIRIFI